MTGKENKEKNEKTKAGERITRVEQKQTNKRTEQIKSSPQ
jgi:hypothetical protein